MLVEVVQRWCVVVGRISVAGGKCPSVLNRNSRGTKKMGKHWAQPAQPSLGKRSFSSEAQRRPSQQAPYDDYSILVPQID